MYQPIDELLMTNQAKINFLKGMIAVIKSDGTINEIEKEFFIEFSESIGLGDSELNTINEAFYSKELDLNIKFDTIEQKMFFLKEAFQVSFLDGNYVDSETKIVYQMGEILGVEKSKIKEIEDWTIEGFNWHNKGQKIFGISEDLLKS